MIKWTLKSLSEADVDKLLNTFHLLGKDYDEKLYRIRKLLGSYKQDLINNNPDYRGIYYAAFDMITLDHMSQKLMSYYCYTEAQIEVREGTIFNSDYTRFRRNFINMSAARKRRFKQYLADRNIDENEYWAQYLAGCKAREYHFIAQYIDNFVPFPEKDVDPIRWLQQWNNVYHPAYEIITHDMCYTEIP